MFTALSSPYLSKVVNVGLLDVCDVPVPQVVNDPREVDVPRERPRDVLKAASECGGSYTRRFAGHGRARTMTTLFHGDQDFSACMDLSTQNLHEVVSSE